MLLERTTYLVTGVQGRQQHERSRGGHIHVSVTCVHQLGLQKPGRTSEALRSEKGLAGRVESKALVTLTSGPNLGSQLPREAGHRSTYLQSQLSYGEMGGRETQRSAGLANVKKQTRREPPRAPACMFLALPSLPHKDLQKPTPKT